MKSLFKQTKVVYNAVDRSFDVFYKTWFMWKVDSTYRWDENPNRPVYYVSYQQAKDRALTRAKEMLNSRVIWEGSVLSSDIMKGDDNIS